MPEWVTIVLTAVAVLAAAVLAFCIGYDRGRNKGRMEVLADWWRAEEISDARPPRSLDTTLDEIMRRNPTGGIVPPFITDKIPGHEQDQPLAPRPERGFEGKD